MTVAGAAYRRATCRRLEQGFQERCVDGFSFWTDVGAKTCRINEARPGLRSS